MSSAEFQFWLFSTIVPALAVVFAGAALIVWIVMSQRTRRQAIIAGWSAEQCARPSLRPVALRVGVFLCGLGAALLLIGLFRLDDDSPYTWALILLGCGSALILNHRLLRKAPAKA